MDFKNISYYEHEKLFENDLIDENRKKIAASWFDKTTADYWRHARAYAYLEAFDKESSWLTVGDGRYGLDSVRIKDRGFKRVMPSDICEALLMEGKKKGIIDEYAVQNAEQMDYKEGEFDYVFCKEAFHHFSRPYIALYEMLRVADKGIILIEPNDRRGG